MIWTGEAPVEKSTGAVLTVQWEKMSKSKYNGVEPQDILEKYGIDSTRLCIVAGVAPKSDRLWSEDGMLFTFINVNSIGQTFSP